jgi:hypothetical protein
LLLPDEVLTHWFLNTRVMDSGVLAAAPQQGHSGG